MLTNQFLQKLYFNPLPPHGGRPVNKCIRTRFYIISIHSLRMEGDVLVNIWSRRFEISIHSLRMEGDCHLMHHIITSECISIHSLRMEGDG